MSQNRIVRTIDRISERLGRTISWLALIMVLIGAYNAIVRYLGRFINVNLSSNMYLELQWYLFSVLFLLGAGYALKEDAHVRVDVIYGRVSPRAKAWINVIGGALLLLPFSIFVLVMSWPSVRNSWQIREGSPDPGGLPRYPLKAVILLCFVLLLLQGVSQFLKDVAVLRGNQDVENEAGEPVETGPSEPGASSSPDDSVDRPS